MSVNEISLITSEKSSFLNQRLLGVMSLVGAPMLLVEMIIRSLLNEPEKLNEQLVGGLGIFYIGGWIAGAVGMRRERATGNTTGSRIIFIIQLTGLMLAFLFSLQQLFGIDYEVSGPFWTVTDIAYPFSHVFMLVVGIFVWRAGIWRGTARLAPWLIGIGLPLFFVLLPLIGMTAVSLGFSGFNALGLGTIGYTIYKNGVEH